VQTIKKKSIGVKSGFSLAALHLCLVILAFSAYITSSSSTSGLVFMWFFFLDAPIRLLPSSLFEIFGVAAPLISFGALGSALWFLIPWLVDRLVVNIFPNAGRKIRWVVVIGAIPLILIGFTALGNFAVIKSIQRERPAELKKMLNSASSDFLTAKAILADSDYDGISSIRLMNCRANAGMEILLSLPSEVIFINNDYQEQHRLKFDENRFITIEPLYMGDTNACMFMARTLFEGVYLYNSEGKEIWKITRQDGHEAAIDGAKYGDVDGDKKPEFAIYHRYSQGIHLVDQDGKTMWRYPVNAIGHLEMVDVNGDGKAEIIFSKSNNARGITEFVILDATGAVAYQLKIPTTSYEFSIVGWPMNESAPNLLLTEENKIRIVDLQGETVFQLTAPGCRAFGKVKAATVKLKKEESKYLAVKKSLHPDLSVLYVYNPNGRLVYQKTEVIKGVLAPMLTAGPTNEVGLEKLIVGASREYNTQVLEYSATR
jgi:hypothetical protein